MCWSPQPLPAVSRPVPLIGHLALACSDGCVRILPVVKRLGDFQMTRVAPGSPLLCLAPSKVHLERHVFPTTLDWCKRSPDRLAVGYNTGFVAMYVLEATLIQETASLSPGTVHLQPTAFRRLFDKAVRSVAVSPCDWRLVAASSTLSPHALLVDLTAASQRQTPLELDILGTVGASILWPEPGDFLLLCAAESLGSNTGILLTAAHRPAKTALRLVLNDISVAAFNSALNIVPLGTRSGQLRIVSLSSSHIEKLLSPKSVGNLAPSEFPLGSRLHLQYSLSRTPPAHGSLSLPHCACPSTVQCVHRLLQHFSLSLSKEENKTPINWQLQSLLNINGMATNSNPGTCSWIAVSLQCGLIHILPMNQLFNPMLDNINNCDTTNSNDYKGIIDETTVKAPNKIGRPRKYPIGVNYRQLKSSIAHSKTINSSSSSRRLRTIELRPSHNDNNDSERRRTRSQSNNTGVEGEGVENLAPRSLVRPKATKITDFFKSVIVDIKEDRDTVELEEEQHCEGNTSRNRTLRRSDLLFGDYFKSTDNRIKTSDCHSFSLPSPVTPAAATALYTEKKSNDKFKTTKTINRISKRLLSTSNDDIEKKSMENNDYNLPSKKQSQSSEKRKKGKVLNNSRYKTTKSIIKRNKRLLSISDDDIEDYHSPSKRKSPRIKLNQSKFTKLVNRRSKRLMSTSSYEGIDKEYSIKDLSDEENNMQIINKRLNNPKKKVLQMRKKNSEEDIKIEQAEDNEGALTRYNRMSPISPKVNSLTIQKKIISPTKTTSVAAAAVVAARVTRSSLNLSASEMSNGNIIDGNTENIIKQNNNNKKPTENVEKKSNIAHSCSSNENLINKKKSINEEKSINSEKSKNNEKSINNKNSKNNKSLIKKIKSTNKEIPINKEKSINQSKRAIVRNVEVTSKKIVIDKSYNKCSEHSNDKSKQIDENKDSLNKRKTRSSFNTFMNDIDLSEISSYVDFIKGSPEENSKEKNIEIESSVASDYLQENVHTGQKSSKNIKVISCAEESQEKSYEVKDSSKKSCNLKRTKDPADGDLNGILSKKPKKSIQISKNKEKSINIEKPINIEKSKNIEKSSNKERPIIKEISINNENPINITKSTNKEKSVLIEKSINEEKLIIPTKRASIVTNDEITPKKRKTLQEPFNTDLMQNYNKSEIIDGVVSPQKATESIQNKLNKIETRGKIQEKQNSILMKFLPGRIFNADIDGEADVVTLPPAALEFQTPATIIEKDKDQAKIKTNDNKRPIHSKDLIFEPSAQSTPKAIRVASSIALDASSSMSSKQNLKETAAFKQKSSSSKDVKSKSSVDENRVKQLQNIFSMKRRELLESQSIKTNSAIVKPSWWDSESVSRTEEQSLDVSHIDDLSLRRSPKCKSNSKLANEQGLEKVQNILKKVASQNNVIRETPKSSPKLLQPFSSLKLNRSLNQSE